MSWAAIRTAWTATATGGHASRSATGIGAHAPQALAAVVLVDDDPAVVPRRPAPSIGPSAGYLRVVSVLRFHIPPEHALLTLADASGGLSALFAFDAHMEHHLAWLTEAAEALGHGPEREDDEVKDSRAIANAQAETIRALRTELAELAADAEAQLPEGITFNVPIVTETPLPFLPDTLGPRELLHVEKTFKRGMATHLLAATESLGPLAERLAGFGDEECGALAERIAAFVVAVRGADA
jgi:hypothetical protein